MSQGKWILIIEDEVELCENYKIKLVAEGLKVLTANTVLDAGAKLANQEFGVIVLDIRLGEESGEKVIAALKKNKASVNFATPILITSGELDVDLITRIRADVKGVMVKPFSLDDLATKVKSLLN